jgi:hypothetical protein
MYFNAHMITASLNRREWEKAESFVQALADYTAQEPFAWSSFLIDRARILIRVGRGESGGTVKAELARLSALGRTYNFVRATRALEEAIVSCN